MSATRTIAVCGKGGAGKTTLSALIARACVESQGKRLLAVDADHAGGLTMALGLASRGEPRTLEHVRQRLAEQLRARTTSKRTAPRELDSLLLEALAERGSLALLTAGRPVERGCYCALNALLRLAIARLSGEFDVTIIDAEAGVEQVSREVLGVIDRLLLVVDGSARSVRVAEAIVSVATDASGSAGVVVNRARDPGELGRMRSMTALPVLGAVPEDDLVHRFDAEGRSLLDLPECPALSAVAAIAGALLSVGCPTAPLIGAESTPHGAS
jgi:CO dehydrogenase maturation factor